MITKRLCACAIDDLRLGMREATWLVDVDVSEDERQELKRRQAGGAAMPARMWRRIRILLMLSEGRNVRATAESVGCYPREVRRIGKRYVRGGLVFALADDPRPKPKRMLDSSQEAALVAMICGPAPEGIARWSVRLAAKEAVKRGIVNKVGRETIRLVLENHGLKPWREKNVVHTQDRSGVR
jgi:putative transposase